MFFSAVVYFLFEFCLFILIERFDSSDQIENFYIYCGRFCKMKNSDFRTLLMTPRREVSSEDGPASNPMAPPTQQKYVSRNSTNFHLFPTGTNCNFKEVLQLDTVSVDSSRDFMDIL
jgi:hypothetical protein